MLLFLSGEELFRLGFALVLMLELCFVLVGFDEVDWEVFLSVVVSCL